jgi:hypothetical protein
VPLIGPAPSVRRISTCCLHEASGLQSRLQVALQEVKSRALKFGERGGQVISPNRDTKFGIIPIVHNAYNQFYI